MRRTRHTLIVFGMRTYLGREVARFGRAMGHRIVGVVDEGIPEFKEPWMHGIHWSDHTDPLKQTWPDAPVAAILYCDTTLWESDAARFETILLQRPKTLMQNAGEMDPRPRFVLRSTVDQAFLPSRHTFYSRRAEVLLTDSELPGAILRLPLLYGPDRPDSVAAMMIARTMRRIPIGPISRIAPSAMRVETAALAALRAALEPDVAGIIEPHEIEEIGDVMIPQ